jgi:hypothetical protein
MPRQLAAEQLIHNSSFDNHIKGTPYWGIAKEGISWYALW